MKFCLQTGACTLLDLAIYHPGHEARSGLIFLSVCGNSRGYALRSRVGSRLFASELGCFNLFALNNIQAVSDTLLTRLPTMDSTEIGRFGTLRLVKRLDPQTIVASFPIDDESVTFGRDPNCSVRLYYPTVSAVHAKIFFQERKVCLHTYSKVEGDADSSIGFPCCIGYERALRRRMSSLPSSNGIITHDHPTTQQL